ncbi:amylo-alpha-1,6-glucosidase [Actinoplanes auranticolor]|uniref:amylo-alpha-1,6-glucosidase n=1 Tax=Actinoplanes auranticolor TaxID=47988 RepID=UPI001BB42B5C|nr:glycogen debranching N-terminal domain-containing protein [Actinoplanes auranticolor]
MSGHSVVAGTTCLLTTAAGADVGGSAVDGFFVDDCRHLSRLVLWVPGARLRALRTDAASTVYAPETARHEDPPYAVVRRRRLEPGRLVESLTLTSYLGAAQTVEVGYEVAADFADQFELRSARTFDKSDAVRRAEVVNGRLVLSYARRGFERTTTIRASPTAQLSAGRLEWMVVVPPLASVTLEVTVSGGAVAAGGFVEDVGAAIATGTGEVAGAVKVGDAAELGEAGASSWTDTAGSPSAPQDDLNRCVRQGLADLDALCMPAPGVPGAVVPAAGAPWFLTVFGRDSLLASLFALSHRPELAAGTLRVLAAAQGRTTDDSRIEEPGKVLHEMRHGELATTGEVPYARYYGSVDATPLFLMLLAAHHEVTGDDLPAKELEQAARAAVGWMFGPGGLAAGYLRYRTDLPGLVHHCWKDSADSIVFSDGTPATGPIAVAEAQGYAYRALLGTARLATHVWGDPAWAAMLTTAAAGLRDRFARDFRLPDGFVALALDGTGTAVDAAASDAGHLLWCGLLADDWAATVADRLAGDDFFSGWGVRTLAAGQTPYHPMSYHRGGVWPHDTAIAVAGLAAAGRRAEAARIADGLLAAASFGDGRLPEVMTGLARERGYGPVPYPHSCSPQAWAAAAPLLLLSL